MVADTPRFPQSRRTQIHWIVLATFLGSRNFVLELDTDELGLWASVFEKIPAGYPVFSVIKVTLQT